MLWLEKNRETNNQVGGGGDNYSGLEGSPFIPKETLATDSIPKNVIQRFFEGNGCLTLEVNELNEVNFEMDSNEVPLSQKYIEPSENLRIKIMQRHVLFKYVSKVSLSVNPVVA